MCRSGFSADAERKGGMQFPAGGGTESESRERTKAGGFYFVCLLESVGGVCKPLLPEGSMAIVEGRLQNADYTDSNGVKHYAMEIYAHSVDFGESKQAPETSQNAAQGNYNGNPQNYPSNTQNAYSVPPDAYYNGYGEQAPPQDYGQQQRRW